MKKLQLPLSVLLMLATSFLFASCFEQTKSEIEPITIKEAYGQSAEEISERWKTPVVPMDSSFDLLVSKNLHPYQLPPGHELLRFGSAYLVLEFADGKLIAIHKVHG